VAQRYPGRASMAAHLDLLMTLLHLGGTGWKQLLQQREELLPLLQQLLQGVAAQSGERLLHTPGNPISVAMTVASGGVAHGVAGAKSQHGDHHEEQQQVQEKQSAASCNPTSSSAPPGTTAAPSAAPAAAPSPTFLGAMLWSR
jgi:O-phospho-L-seryl-tRNASec:L-selenocysteinyl-tRNA synthase